MFLLFDNSTCIISHVYSCVGALVWLGAGSSATCLDNMETLPVDIMAVPSPPPTARAKQPDATPSDKLRDQFQGAKVNKDMQPTAEMGASREFTPEKPKNKSVNADAYTPDEKARRVFYTLFTWVPGDVWLKC